MTDGGLTGGAPDEVTGRPGRRDETLRLLLSPPRPADTAGGVGHDGLHGEAAGGGAGGGRGGRRRGGGGGDCPVDEDSRHTCQDVALAVTSPARSVTSTWRDSGCVTWHSPWCYTPELPPHW